jgi:membrane peptidoglycan carboxypeptidase
MVGPENPDFRPLDQIPAFLRNAVLISEDGAFFGHKGFLLGPIKDSIAANLREKRFVRGASTISMQLVKNLYLNRQKTIARKFEEMIITWLMEENRLVSKERMYEIYLNIIEWGPLVYGAQEAARFYFDKDVADLTLAEAIFMASIVPRPRLFMYSFDPDRRLRPWLEAYYRDVSFKMLKREMIGQQDYDALLPDIRLKGPARFLLKGNENVPPEELDEETIELP